MDKIKQAMTELREWHKKYPETDTVAKIKVSDYMGEYEFIAEWVQYKNQKGKGRWMKRNERRQLERLSRKELPDAWRYLDVQEAIEYFGLSEDDLKQEID